MIYKNLIHPFLLYGSKTWVLTKREQNRILVFEKKLLRTIYGRMILDGVYRTKNNFELDREFKCLNVIGVVKRGAENLPQRALFRVKPKGRPKKTKFQLGG
jgi:hypothetical protein